MISTKQLIKEFTQENGVMTSRQLNELGLSSRQIKKLVNDQIISKIKQGYYQMVNDFVEDQIIISKLYPKAVIFLESALLHYEYTDRIPREWQIAVNKNEEKSKYNIDFPSIKPFYIKPEFLDIGLSTFLLNHQIIRIYNRDRTICDVLRYENKLEKEVVTQSIKNYLNDPKKNISQFIEYANIFNIREKAENRIGMWL